MTNKTKKFAAVGVLSLSLVLAAGVVTFSGNELFFKVTQADDAGVTFSGANGAVSASTLKTTITASKTALGNDVSVVYKNAAVVAGKVGTVKKGGYYGNYDPIWAMSKIVLTSTAATGDAVVKYGKTSACLDGEADLAAGTIEGINANYFKVVAKNDVTLDSIAITFGCDNSDNGFEVSYEGVNKNSEYEFVKQSNGSFDFRLKSSSAYHYCDKIVVPDYYGTGADYGPVKRMMNNGSYGFFERAYNVKDIYLPETLEEFGTFFFNGTHDYIKTFTFPRELKTASSTGLLLPGTSTSLETIYYNSKNLSYSGTQGIKAGFTGLKDIYVSYDVETLPNKLVSSFPAGCTLHYEGTEAEWAALVATASNWNTASSIICSDTTVVNVAFTYENSTLNGDASGTKNVEVIVGKTVADPGSPVWTGEGSKVFNGWYTAAEGGTKVTFPYAPTENTTLYAQFIDMPAGYSLTDPLAVVKGQYDVETRADLGKAKYFKYTASEAEAVYFEASNIASSKSKSCELKVFTADGTEVSIGSPSYSASESAKKISNLTNNSSSRSTVKINFTAGETYIVGLSTYNFTDGYYGTATLKVFASADNYGDPTSAKPYTLGTDARMTDLKDNIPMWHSFTPTESGTYTVEFNNAGDKNCSNSIGYIDADGNYVELGKSNFSATNVFVSLTAGTTYYVVNTSNGTAGTYGFKVFLGTPNGYGIDNAITMTVDGDPVNNKNNGFYWNYFKFTVATDGYYKLTGNVNIFSQDSTTYNSTSSSQYVQLSKNADMSDLIKGTRELVSSSSSYIYFNLTAGTYYMKATVTSSSTNTFALSSVANPEGLTVESAKAITLSSGTPIDTSDAGENGKLYKFTVTSEQFHVFTAGSGATVKIGTKSDSSLVSNFSTSYEMSNGEMHKKLTVGNTYYMYVKGATSVGFENVASIQDGETRETAYTYNIGDEEKTTSNGGRIKTTCTYFNVTPAETGEYIVTRGSTSYYYFKMFDGDSSLSATSTSSYKQTYTLTGGKTYRIEAYYYGFSIIKAAPGYARSDAINTTIAADTTSVDFVATFGTDGTWYKFTAQSNAWYEFATTSTATATIYVGTSTSAACTASSTAGDVKLAEGDVVYLCVKGTKDATFTFTIAHPASVENGLTEETAWTFTPDTEGGDTMTYQWTGASSSIRVYMRLTVVAGKKYSFAIASDGTADATDGYSTSSASMALINETGTATLDESAGYGGSAFTKYGAESDDACYVFTATTSGTVLVSYKHYKAGPYATKAIFRDQTSPTPTADAELSGSWTLKGSFYDDYYEDYIDVTVNITITVEHLNEVTSNSTKVGTFVCGYYSDNIYLTSHSEKEYVLELYCSGSASLTVRIDDDGNITYASVSDPDNVIGIDATDIRLSTITKQ